MLLPKKNGVKRLPHRARKWARRFAPRVLRARDATLHSMMDSFA
ncbi:hypothetical protein MYA_4952 [Burkholderia sp. KJ006]|nr:hypothetical protein MYA_4952 [Burkholderia sp. KJ006]